MQTLRIFLLWLACSGPAAAASRPDILLIMPDQMRGDCMSCLGHPVVRTCELDKLAGTGVLFRRAYSTAPSCIPARHSLLTGLFPQTSGAVGFASRPVRWPTMPRLLADSGYATALSGRTMHQLPPDEPYGYQRLARGSTYVEDDDYDRYLKAAAPESGGIRKVVAKTGVTYNGWQGHPWPLRDELHPTAWIVRQARLIVEETDPSRLLFLTVSFYAPHPPLFPPAKYFDAYYSNEALPGPARGDWVHWDSLTTAGDRQGHRVLLQGDALRRAQAGYYGLIEHLDHELAPLIDEFKARSQKRERPWVIIVCSDHGEMLGDHGFFRKCEPYEGSANIPFIIAAAPELGLTAGRRNHQPVCLEDIMPTLLDLAGVKIPDLMDGISLVPVLLGQKESVRSWLHFEHATTYSREQAFHALTDGRQKYIWRPLDGSEQLFDLREDAREEHDLSEDPKATAVLAQWRGRLIQRLSSRPEGFCEGDRLVPGRSYGPLLPDSTSPGPARN